MFGLDVKTEGHRWFAWIGRFRWGPATPFQVSMGTRLQFKLAFGEGFSDDLFGTNIAKKMDLTQGNDTYHGCESTPNKDFSN